MRFGDFKVGITDFSLSVYCSSDVEFVDDGERRAVYMEDKGKINTVLKRECLRHLLFIYQ